MSSKSDYTQLSTTAIDLFAGAGGLSTGLVAAGYRVVGAVELDPVAASTFRMNHPRAELFIEDIRKLTGPTLLSHCGLKRGELGLLTGCPPCQGFSTLRTRRRTQSDDSERNDLIFEVLRLVRSIRPWAVLVENVPGLSLDTRFEKFLMGLRTSGYEPTSAVLDAQLFGVPQRRKRLVIAATRRGKLPMDLLAATGEQSTVRMALQGLEKAGQSGDPLHDMPERRSERILRRIRLTPKDGGSRTDLPSDVSELACHMRNKGYYDVYGRMAWNKVAPTITSGCTNPSKGRFIHPEEDRAITLREAALLQSFPASYQFDLSRGKESVARQIGNAFPPKLIEPIARRLLRKEE